MPMFPQITLILTCSIISSLALLVAVRSVYAGVDYRSFFLTVILMTMVNGVHLLSLNPVLEWVIIAVADFVILLKVLDCSGYFSIVAMGAWIGLQILFYEYLAGPLTNMMMSGS